MNECMNFRLGTFSFTKRFETHKSDALSTRLNLNHKNCHKNTKD